MTAFTIGSPALISFSGGRTSAYLLRQILDAHDGTLPNDVHVVFANTGKEREETLAFVRECGVRWDVPIHWIERDSGPEGVRRGSLAYRTVTFESASRRGEPFAALIAHRGYLPNPALRMCTTELKIRVMKRFMRARGHAHWDMVMGIRADEPHRVRKLRAPTSERWEHLLPLADAGVTEADVMAFWAAQPFDLRLKPHEGNCDLCHLKAFDTRVVIMAEHPEFAAWWAEQEQRAGQQFLAGTRSRKAEPDYGALNALAPKLAPDARRRLLLAPDSEAGGDCVCHD